MFQLVDAPTSLPGACYLCSSGTKSPFIDWGVSIDFYGALYTCSECTGAVASLLGMATREQHAKNIQELDQLRAENLELSIQNRAYKQACELLDLVKVNESISHMHDKPYGSVADLDIDLLADNKDVDEKSRDSDELLDSGKGASDESSDDKGVDKLRSTSKRADHKFSV